LYDSDEVDEVEKQDKVNMYGNEKKRAGKIKAVKETKYGSLLDMQSNSYKIKIEEEKQRGNLDPINVVPNCSRKRLKPNRINMNYGTTNRVRKNTLQYLEEIDSMSVPQKITKEERTLMVSKRRVKKVDRFDYRSKAYSVCESQSDDDVNSNDSSGNGSSNDGDDNSSDWAASTVTETGVSKVITSKVETFRFKEHGSRLKENTEHLGILKRSRKKGPLTIDDKIEILMLRIFDFVGTYEISTSALSEYCIMRGIIDTKKGNGSDTIDVAGRDAIENKNTVKVGSSLDHVSRIHRSETIPIEVVGSGPGESKTEGKRKPKILKQKKAEKLKNSEKVKEVENKVDTRSESENENKKQNQQKRECVSGIEIADTDIYEGVSKKRRGQWTCSYPYAGGGMDMSNSCLEMLRYIH